jgi:hypothetical protein
MDLSFKTAILIAGKLAIIALDHLMILAGRSQLKTDSIVGLTIHEDGFKLKELRFQSLAGELANNCDRARY